jgi:hypothetical protein
MTLAVYHGAYSIELVEDAEKRHLPAGVKLDNRKIIVGSGYFRVRKDHIVFYVDGKKPFTYPVNQIEFVRDDRNLVLWPQFN